MTTQFTRPTLRDNTTTTRPVRRASTTTNVDYEDENNVRPAAYLHLNMHLDNGMTRQLGKNGIPLFEGNVLHDLLINECLNAGVDINDLLDQGVFSLTINSGTSAIPETVGFGSRLGKEVKTTAPAVQSADVDELEPEQPVKRTAKRRTA